VLTLRRSGCDLGNATNLKTRIGAFDVWKHPQIFDVSDECAQVLVAQLYDPRLVNGARGE
jgi:hypothetical protein